MPAKKHISKEKIIKAAIGIIREDGMDALSVRAIAKKCSCSTQPVYLSFNSVDELKSEVVKKFLQIFYEFIEKEIKSGEYPEYKAIGMGYIKFAIQEKEIFKYLFMRKRKSEDDFEKDSFDKSTFVIMQNYGLYKDDAYKFHAEMWVFVHGIATMFATEYLDWDWNTVDEMVSDAFRGMIKSKNGEKNDNRN